jgi:hypothetical protein
MRPSKRNEGLRNALLLDSSIKESLADSYLDYLGEHECEICGAEPLEQSVEFICSVPKPRWGEYWAIRYHVCSDCGKAGIASFPDRLRKHAETLEERARELRALADAEWRLAQRSGRGGLQARWSR